MLPIQQLDIQPSTFRPIHYLGSKLRLANVISSAIDEVDPDRGRVCDLFAGSGTVAGILSSTRPVTAIDTQEYARVLCSALLNPACMGMHEVGALVEQTKRSPLFDKLQWAFDPLTTHESICRQRALSGNPGPLADLIEAGSLIAFHRYGTSTDSQALRAALVDTITRLAKVRLLESADSVTARYFGGLYFSYSQAIVLDALLACAHASCGRYRDSIIAAVLSTASQAVNTVGKQFAQPLRPRTKTGQVKKSLVLKVDRDRSLDIWSTFHEWLLRYTALPTSGRNHQAIAGDYLHVMSHHDAKMSVVYADPPYTRDHYSRYYHVLETMTLRDNPDVSTVRIRGQIKASRAIYRTNRYQSPFCIKSKAPDAFNSLFATTRSFRVPLVLSYSPHEAGDGTHPRVVPMRKIIELAKHHFNNVEIETVDAIAHSRLNSNLNRLPARLNAEVILKCRP